MLQSNGIVFSSIPIDPPGDTAVRSAAVTWLFVGRLAPNKAQHDIVKAFAAYRRFHNPDAHLNLVGGGREDGYARTLQRFIHALGLDDAVTLTGLYNVRNYVHFGLLDPEQ